MQISNRNCPPSYDGPNSPTPVKPSTKTRLDCSLNSYQTMKMLLTGCTLISSGVWVGSMLRGSLQVPGDMRADADAVRVLGGRQFSADKRRIDQNAVKEHAWRSFAAAEAQAGQTVPPFWYSTVDLLKDPRTASLLDMAQEHQAKQLGADVRAVGRVPFSILKQPAYRPRAQDRLILLAIDAPTGVLSDTVRYLAAQLGQLRDGVYGVMSVDSHVLNQTVDPETSRLFRGLVQRERHGDEFAAFSQLLQLFPDLWDVNQLSFTNDSHYGPLSLARLVSLFRRIDASKSALVGLTETMAGPHNQTCWHYQKSFFTLQHDALRHRGIQYFWLEQVFSYGNQTTMAQHHELAMTQKVADLGLPTEALFSLFDIDRRLDPTMRLANTLIERGYPFLQKSILSNPRLQDALAQLDLSILEDEFPFNLTHGVGRHGQDLLPLAQPEAT